MAAAQSTFHDKPWRDFLLSSQARGSGSGEAIQTAEEKRQHGILKSVTHVGWLDAASEIHRLQPFYFFIRSPCRPFSPSPFRWSLNLAWSACSTPVPSAISSQINQTFESRSTHTPYPTIHHPHRRTRPPAENFVTGRHCREFKSWMGF